MDNVPEVAASDYVIHAVLPLASNLIAGEQVLQNILAVYERRPIRWLRDWGTQFAIDYIHAEDKQTNYVDIGPVNKVTHVWPLTRLYVWATQLRA